MKTLADFTEDRIALPAVGVSVQARHPADGGRASVGRQGRGARQDHRDAGASRRHRPLLSRATEITAHFCNPPFQYQAAQRGKVRMVLSSYEVLGGLATFNVFYHRQVPEGEPQDLPRLRRALKEAREINANNAPRARRLHPGRARASTIRRCCAKIIEDPDTRSPSAPQNTFQFAEFMHAWARSRTSRRAGRTTSSRTSTNAAGELSRAPCARAPRRSGAAVRPLLEVAGLTLEYQTERPVRATWTCQLRRSCRPTASCCSGRPAAASRRS